MVCNDSYLALNVISYEALELNFSYDVQQYLIDVQ